MQIDFIADHDIGALAGESIFEELSKNFDCKWRIGTKQTPSGADAAVMLDHPGGQPKIIKSASGYKYLFFLSHDLGDIITYKADKRRLRNYDIIFAPNALHYKHAKEHLGKETIVLQTGWAKYDKMQFSGEYKELEQKLKGLPYGFTILYAPSFAWSYEWKYLLPLLKSLPCNIIVKNHIYINKGQSLPKTFILPPPFGELSNWRYYFRTMESRYRQHLESADQMEKFMTEGNPTNAIVAPRELNICSLFPYVNLLISDQSSVLMEFVPFGTSIETGRYNPHESDILHEISSICKEVIFLDKPKICEVFSSMENVHDFMTQHKPKTVFNVPKISTGKLTSSLIRKYFEEVGNPGSASNKNFFQSIFSPSKNQSIEDKMLMWRDSFLGEDK